MSIVLTIVATLTGLGIQSGANMIESTRKTQTESKLAQIKRALYVFRVSNNRIPCPASLTLSTTSANFGIQGPNATNCIVATAGAATATNISAGFTVAEGAVPTKTLNLPDEFAFDGWGNRIRYAANVPYTALNAFLSRAPDDSCPGAQVLDGTGASNFRTQSAVYALVSNGPNGHGAYTRSGAIKNAGSTNADEQKNCSCDSSGTLTPYTGVYTQKGVSQNPASANDAFDDIVEYQVRWQMQTQTDHATTNSAPVSHGVDLVNVGYTYINFYSQSGATFTNISANGTLSAQSGPVRAASFSADNTMLAIATDGGAAQAVQVYNINAGVLSLLFSGGGTGNLAMGIDFSPDGRWLAAPVFNSPVLLLYRVCGKSITSIALPANPPTFIGCAATFSPDSKYLAVCNWANPLTRVYQVDNGAFTDATLTVQPPGVAYSYSFTSDSTYFAASGDGNGTPANKITSIYKRSGSTFTALVNPFDIAPTNVRAAVFSHNDTYLAVTSSDAPYLYVYRRSGDAFTKLSNIAPDAGASAGSIAWSNDDSYIAVANGWMDAGAGLALYNRVGDTFTRLPDVLPAPGQNQVGVTFRH